MIRMSATFEDLQILRSAEEIADAIWQHVAAWKTLPRDVVGVQLARAADSIGANIAESFGRFHYGKKLQFLYYARGSLFETKYWLNRTQKRQLMPEEQVKNYSDQLTVLARQLNAFAGGLKAYRRTSATKNSSIRESSIEYIVGEVAEPPLPLFTEDDLNWLHSLA